MVSKTKIEIWKYEGLEWSRKYNRYVTRKFWCVKVLGKTFEGFGTRSEAENYGKNHIATFA